jgi:hypothetical protein
VEKAGALAARLGLFYGWDMRRLTLLVVLVAFMFSCGGQWQVLQCVAWANMIREYSQMVPVTQAVAMTFSGEYPCEMCKLIAEKKESDNAKVALLFVHEKKIAAVEVIEISRVDVFSPQMFFNRDVFLQTRAEAPPVPPPWVA